VLYLDDRDLTQQRDSNSHWQVYDLCTTSAIYPCRQTPQCTTYRL